MLLKFIPFFFETENIKCAGSCRESRRQIWRPRPVVTIRARSVFTWVLLAAVWAICSEPALAMEARLLLDPSPDDVEVTGLPRGWEHLRFQNITTPTKYSVSMDGDRYVLKAVSEASGSGIYTELNLDAREHPYISWQWKVSNIIEKGDATRKSGDDFPARVVVAFRYEPDRVSLFKWIKYELARLIYGRYPPGSALVYVWDNKLPVGTTLDNAYNSWAKMIVLESGPSKVGQWVTERRNFYEDYRRVFGRNPTQLKFIGVMTDTDDTGERAEAYFRTLSLENRSSNSPILQSSAP